MAVGRGRRKEEGRGRRKTGRLHGSSSTLLFPLGAVLLICSGSVWCVLFSWEDKREKKVAAEQEKKQRAFHAREQVEDRCPGQVTGDTSTKSPELDMSEQRAPGQGGRKRGGQQDSCAQSPESPGEERS